MNMEHYLSELGLTARETAAYLSLLKFPGARAGVIAKDVGVKRTSIYETLSALVQKGFASVYFKKSQRVYHPQHPQRVVNLFQNRVDAFMEIIPQLTAISGGTAQATGVRLIQTKEELEKFYLDVLVDYAGTSYDIIGSSAGWINVFGTEFPERFRRLRAKAKIKTRMILSHDSVATEPPTNQFLRDIRFLPDLYHFTSQLHIFSDTIVIVGTQLSAIGVVIAIPAMSDIFKTIFDFLWNSVALEK